MVERGALAVGRVLEQLVAGRALLALEHDRHVVDHEVGRRGAAAGEQRLERARRDAAGDERTDDGLGVGGVLRLQLVSLLGQPVTAV